MTRAYFALKGGGTPDKEVGKDKAIVVQYRLEAKDPALYRLMGDSDGSNTKNFTYCDDCGAIVKRNFTITLSNPQIEYGERFDETVSPPPKHSWQTFANYGREDQYDLLKVDLPKVGNYVLTVIAYEEDNYAETRKDFDVTVSPKSLKTVGTPAVASRPYDGTTNLGAVTLPTLDKTNVVEGDDVSLLFDRDDSAVKPGAGTYDVVFTPRLTNPNYTLEPGRTMTAKFTITPATSTASPTLNGDEIPTSKTYDGTADIALPDGGISIGDGMTICAARFDGAGAGKHKITVDICLDDNHMTADGKSTMEGVELPAEGTIAQKSLSFSGTLAIASRPYDGTTTLGTVSLPTFDKTNVVEGDDVSLLLDQDDSAVKPGAGTYDVVFTPRLSNPNYTLEPGEPMTAKFTISPAVVPTPTLSGNEIPTSKTYDGTADIDLPDGGISIGDGMTICAARFGGAGAGKHKITVDICLDDNHMTADGKSTMEGVELPAEGTIAQKALTLGGEATIRSRQYDGTVGVERRLITLPALEGVVDGDDVSLYCYATLDNAWAGERTVTISLSIGGAASRNYTLAESVIRANMTILPRAKRPVAIVVRNAESLVYGHSVVGVLPTDDVRIDTDPIVSGTTYIDGRDAAVTLPVGDAQPLRVSFVPVDTLNYMSVDTTIYVTVRPLQLSLTGETAVVGTKEYDGTDDALALVSSVPRVKGVLGDDDVSLAVTSARTDSKAVGARSVTVRYALTGDDAGNYTLAEEDLHVVASTMVYTKALTIEPPQFSTTSKEYDGTTAAPPMTTTPALLGAVEGDDVTLRWTAEYDSPEVGDRLITVAYTLDGDDAGNYTAPEAYAASGEIVAKEPEPDPTPDPDSNPTPDPDPNPDPTPAPDPEPDPEPTPNPEPEPEYHPLAATATIAKDSLCADEPLTVTVEVTSGTATTWSITFDDNGQKAGFTDITYAEVQATAGETFSIGIPTPPTDFFGAAGATLTLADERDERLPLALSFARRPDASHLHVKFGNTIVVDNVEGRIASYQWTADGVAIPGATRQFYHANPLPAAQYAVEVTLTDGTRHTTCPLTLDGTAPTAALSALPNPVGRGERVRVSVGGEMPGDAVVEVYNSAGEMVRRVQAADEAGFVADLPQGVYICRVVGKKVAGNVKLVVK